MGTWALGDVPWDRFDASKVDLEIIPIAKAASMVEYNANDYRQYLRNIFEGDDRALRAIDQWTIEQVQHGCALGQLAELADPDFDFERTFRRFVDNFNIPLSTTESVRGSLAGALGLDPTGPLGWMATRAVRSFIWYRGRLCPRIAVWLAKLSNGWPSWFLPDRQISSR